jgi:DNA-binding NarL/FixJ family response regulator
VDRIRILLGPMPQLLREILKSGFLAEPEMEVVGDTREGEGLVGLCAERRPDVIVLEADEAFESELASAIRINPALKILAVAPSGRDARMHQLQWRVDVVPDVSFIDLRDAILAAVRPDSGGALSVARTSLHRRE